MVFQKMKDGSCRVKDANKADQYLSAVEKMIVRMQRQGKERDLSTTLSEKAQELGVVGKAMGRAIAAGNKKEALRLFSQNVRLLNNIRATPSLSPEMKSKTEKLLGNMSVVEKEINALKMKDADPEKKRKFEFVKSKMHPDYKTATSILVNEGGRGTVLANVDTIRPQDLDRLYKLYGGK